MGGKLEAVEDV